MISVNNDKVDARDLHESLEVKKHFATWIKEKIQEADLQEEKDFIFSLGKSNGGRPTVEYLLTVDAAKEICLLQQTSKGKELRRYLIEISKQKDEGDLLNHDQIVYLSQLKAVFMYLENCTIAEQKHFKEFEQSLIKNPKTNPYASFHEVRNRILDIGKETINKRIKEYCVENSRIVSPKNKREALAILDKYELIRNGVWDFLMAAQSDQAMKLANLVKRMAQAENSGVYLKNEDNLFQSKQELPIGIVTKLIN